MKVNMPKINKTIASVEFQLYVVYSQKSFESIDSKYIPTANDAIPMHNVRNDDN